MCPPIRLLRIDILDSVCFHQLLVLHLAIFPKCAFPLQPPPAFSSVGSRRLVVVLELPSLWPCYACHFPVVSDRRNGVRLERSPSQAFQPEFNPQNYCTNTNTRKLIFPLLRRKEQEDSWDSLVSQQSFLPAWWVLGEWETHMCIHAYTHAQDKALPLVIRTPCSLILAYLWMSCVVALSKHSIVYLLVFYLVFMDGHLR